MGCSRIFFLLKLLFIEAAISVISFSFRLQYFARGVQVYIKQLRLALQGKTGDALKTDEVTSHKNTTALHLSSIFLTYYYAAGGLFGQYKNGAKNLKNY